MFLQSLEVLFLRKFSVPHKSFKRPSVFFYFPIPDPVVTTSIRVLQSRWTSEVCEDIKTRLKDLQFSRYKFVVQVVIGEQRGEGVKMATKCFWDSETDNYVKHVFMNENFFVVAVAFGSYFY